MLKNCVLRYLDYKTSKSLNNAERRIFSMENIKPVEGLLLLNSDEEIRRPACLLSAILADFIHKEYIAFARENSFISLPKQIRYENNIERYESDILDALSKNSSVKIFDLVKSTDFDKIMAAKGIFEKQIKGKFFKKIQYVPTKKGEKIADELESTKNSLDYLIGKNLDDFEDLGLVFSFPDLVLKYKEHPFIERIKTNSEKIVEDACNKLYRTENFFFRWA
jgi:hypothetical protein